MSYRGYGKVCLGVYALPVLLVFSPTIWAQGLPTSYPSYVADAQIPIESNDGFNNPQGIAVAPGGIVYVADSGNHRVLKIAPGRVQTTVSFGNLSPALQTPVALALDGSGNLYVLDAGTKRLIEVPSNGTAAKTLLGSPYVYAPIALASDSQGNLAFLNQGNADIFSLPAGGQPGFYSYINTPLSSNAVPSAVAFDQQGQLYFSINPGCCQSSHVYRLPTGIHQAVDISPPGYYLGTQTAVAVDAANDVIILNAGGNVSSLIEIPASGNAAFVLPETNLIYPIGLAVDNLGNVYVADNDSVANSVTKYVFQNAANFGSVPVGTASAPITFNFAFYEETTIEQTLGFGGGELGAEYREQPGSTCIPKTYKPEISNPTNSVPIVFPATCQVQFSFTPRYVGGRPGAVQLKTSNGRETQLTFGSGLGGQLALMNAAVSTKLSNANGVLVNAADTEIYYSGSQGTYRIPVGGGQPTLVAAGFSGPFAINGAGDLFYASLPGPQGTITRVPADGSAPTTITVTGLANVAGIAMDYNGAFYIANIGPDYSNPSGYVIRVSPLGAESQVLPGAWVFPYLMTADLSGNIWIADSYTQNSIEVQVGSGSDAISGGPQISGLSGIFPTVAAMDESQTLYYWDNYPDFSNVGFEYFPFVATGCPWINCQVPLYTIPPIDDGYGWTPFYVASITAAPDGKMYIGNGAGSGTFLVNRNLGSIPAAVFSPDVPIYGGSLQTEFVYNIGNQNVTFTDPDRIFTESGSGVGSFTYGVPGSGSGLPVCVPGAVIAPASFCAFTVNNTKQPGSTPIVTERLHFLTDAVNNNQVSFEINGAENTKPK